MKVICKLFLAVALLFSSYTVIGQKVKTIYLDDNWNKTNKENADYFRQLNKVSSGEYKVEDFYISGQLQMSGQYQDKKLRYSTGEFIYYDTLGILKKIENYVDNMQDGIQMKFYSNGQMKILENYTKDRRHGVYREFYKDSSVRAEATFKTGRIRGQARRYSVNGKLIFHMGIDSIGNGELTAYYLNGDIRKEGVFNDGVQFGTWNTYNRGNDLVKTKEYPKRLNEYNKPNNSTRHPEDLVGQFFSGYDFGNEELFGLVYYPDVEAHFSGGAQELQRYISNFLVYPEKAIWKCYIRLDSELRYCC